jgi:hypothetical protein
MQICTRTALPACFFNQRASLARKLVSPGRRGVPWRFPSAAARVVLDRDWMPLRAVAIFLLVALSCGESSHDEGLNRMSLVDAPLGEPDGGAPDAPPIVSEPDASVPDARIVVSRPDAAPPQPWSNVTKCERMCGSYCMRRFVCANVPLEKCRMAIDDAEGGTCEERGDEFRKVSQEKVQACIDAIEAMSCTDFMRMFNTGSGVPAPCHGILS